MDFFDRLWLGKRQKVIVALQGTGAGMKAFAAKVGLTKVEALNLGAHRPVDEQDALARGALERP